MGRRGRGRSGEDHMEERRERGRKGDGVRGEVLKTKKGKRREAGAEGTGS